MKNFKNYDAEKYSGKGYKLVEEGIYKTKDKYGFYEDGVYVTSLTFEQEPDMPSEEGGCPQNITQYPLEEILEEFDVAVYDFYEELNDKSEVTCYQEFGSNKIEDIRNLRTIIGKHVYDEEYEEDGETYIRLKIE